MKPLEPLALLQAGGTPEELGGSEAWFPVRLDLNYPVLGGSLCGFLLFARLLHNLQ
jgi:hypothetical protein